ncbi:MAG: hypothetical protein JW984_00740 [Deltaproteobacteria bacterium]|uniref:Lipoprotein n=1 Tax=Candidatus Zymogenus saltonus TaxID=2844893 RepID=A0A9D8K934_9DELT|nr:hypothetical protein [Candidatus Zymogenus saltonus]
MKRPFWGFLFLAFFLFSCAHSSSLSIDRKEGRRMYYEYPKDSVWDASVVVLKERKWKITEMNRPENLIKAKMSSKIAGVNVRLLLTFKAEGSGTWLEIKEKIPPQFTPGTTYRYKFDINELFHEINIELDRRM